MSGRCPVGRIAAVDGLLAPDMSGRECDGRFAGVAVAAPEPLDAVEPPVAAAWLASGFVAADAAPLAPNDFANMAPCATAIALRPHPPTTPDETAAPSTDGRSL